MVLQRKDIGRYDKKNKALSPPRVSEAPHQRANWNYDGQKSEKGGRQETAQDGHWNQGKERKARLAESTEAHTGASERSRAGSGATNTVLPGEHQGCLLKYGFWGWVSDPNPCLLEWIRIRLMKTQHDFLQ